MQVAETTRLYTAEEYSQMPDDGRLVALVDGELVEMAWPDSDHSTLSGWILTLFNTIVVPNRLGVVTGEQGGYILSQNPDTVLAPDAAFMSQARRQKRGIYYLGEPDLVVEVVSPSNTPTEIQVKMEKFFAAGTQFIWQVYRTPRSIHVFTRRGSTTHRPGDTIDVSIIQHGFTLTVDQIFSVLDNPVENP